MMNLKHLLSCSLVCMIIALGPAAANVVADSERPCTLRVLDVPLDDYRYSFYLRLLEIIMKRTEAAYGHCELIKGEPVSHSRKFHMMKHNQLDIIWNVTTRDLEKDFLSVRVPVHSGLHGFRLLLIRKGEESRFQQVNSLAALKPLVAGVVKDWQVAAVLEDNGLPMEKTDDYANLFPMLKRGRFDYIPLDFVEAYHEMDKHEAQVAMVVEPKMIMHYDSTDFYYVTKDNARLARRLSDGLAMVAADGSKNELFDGFFAFDTLLKRALVSARKVIELRNPDEPREVASTFSNSVFSVESLIKRENAAK